MTNTWLTPLLVILKPLKNKHLREQQDVRVPSRALVLNKEEHLFRCSFFVQAGLKRALHPRKTSFWRVPKTVHRTVFHLALVKTDNRCFGTHIISLCGFLKRSTGPFHISRLLKLRLFYSTNLRLLASTA